MTKANTSRRTFLARVLGALGLTAVAHPAAAAVPTPSATKGPFYPTPAMRRTDVDNDLIKIIGQVHKAGGDVMMLNGSVLNADGAPLADHRVEIWQCDMNGKYMHSGDRQSLEFDAAFQGFGHDITGPDGRYQFRTIKPVTHPGRTPHIHVKVFNGTEELLTTQFYIDGHPANGRDRIFGRLSDAEAAAVSMVFERVDGVEQTTVDITV
ncbi:hypothetical protein ACJ5NV_13020 [Loktanella agnita]|uniref:dioxygenase family protein n=1 Tax=Loktanella agnita TaxID=287097 RepID=UPI003988102C